MTGLSAEALDWLTATGFTVRDESVWQEALTHGSVNAGNSGGRGDSGGNDASEAKGYPKDYQRLEFLGDRVLGLSVASWLYSASTNQEGKLSQRLNVLVSGATCARIARSINLGDHIRLGKQAREDGGSDSDNILGDVMEAVLGASFVDNGYDVTREVIYLLWDGELGGDAGKSKHPKSALQEWAAGNKRAMPNYEIVERSGPDHAARFTVEVSIKNVGGATATANSKSEAEKLAAKAFLEDFG